VNPLRIDPSRAAELRRELGAAPWCALECLLEQADADAIAAASVRSIAADLGIAKNTAHRALAALVRAGLVESIQERDDGGRFRPGRYRLHLAGLHAPSPTPERSRPRSRTTPAPDPAQLSLLA